MTARNMEKLAQERRMRERGTESVHESGYALTRDGLSRKAAEALAHRIDSWKREPTIEEAADENAANRATKEAHLRAILDACED